MADQQPMRTMVAQQAMDFSDLLNLSLAKHTAGSPPCILVVRAPDVVSTEGGKKARQSILLEPQRPGPAGPLMCGWLDVAQKSAELRTFSALNAMSKQRFSRELSVSATDYERMIARLAQLLEMRDIQVARSEERPPPQAKPKGRGRIGFAMVIAGGILAAAIVAAAFILR